LPTAMRMLAKPGDGLLRHTYPTGRAFQCSKPKVVCVSYDLVFWRDPRSERPDPEGIFHALVDGRPVPGLDQLAVEATVRALAERFPGVEPPPAGEAGYSVWEGPDMQAVIEFSWSPQHLMATARGGVTKEQLNWIIDICVDVAGARLYDPQVNERFDSQ
jgi:hypothetical protein